jgi:hypothetical protein
MHEESPPNTTHDPVAGEDKNRRPTFLRSFIIFFFSALAWSICRSSVVSGGAADRLLPELGTNTRSLAGRVLEGPADVDTLLRCDSSTLTRSLTDVERCMLAGRAGRTAAAVPGLACADLHGSKPASAFVSTKRHEVTQLGFFAASVEHSPVLVTSTGTGETVSLMAGSISSGFTTAGVPRQAELRLTKVPARDGESFFALWLPGWPVRPLENHSGSGVGGPTANGLGKEDPCEELGCDIGWLPRSGGHEGAAPVIDDIVRSSPPAGTAPYTELGDAMSRARALRPRPAELPCTWRSQGDTCSPGLLGVMVPSVSLPLSLPLRGVGEQEA